MASATSGIRSTAALISTTAVTTPPTLSGRPAARPDRTGRADRPRAGAGVSSGGACRGPGIAPLRLAERDGGPLARCDEPLPLPCRTERWGGPRAGAFDEPGAGTLEPAQ